MDEIELSYIAGCLDVHPGRCMSYHTRSKSLRLMLPHRQISRQSEVRDILTAVEPMLKRSRPLVEPAVIFIKYREWLDVDDPRLDLMLDSFVAIRDAVARFQPVPAMPELEKSSAAKRILAAKQAREAAAPGSWRGQT